MQSHVPINAQSFGFRGTRVTNAFSVGRALKLGYRIHRGVGPPTHGARDPLKAPKTSVNVRLSLMIIRSMSLADWSVTLATEPY